LNYALWSYHDLITRVMDLTSSLILTILIFCPFLIDLFLVGHCDFFLFALYGVIAISWLGSWFWQVDLSWLDHFLLENMLTMLKYLFYIKTINLTHNTTRYSIIYIQLFDYHIHILDATNFNHNTNNIYS
jgi:hypothetical protein